MLFQDSGRLLDFDYSDEDIDSLRKQMRLPEPQSPASSLSDELGALGEQPLLAILQRWLDMRTSPFVPG